ncbi:hypothetical protein [Chryseobacterium sp. KBW03]|uniref:hypothetical protein n=1 Tax=Chryseobacterium sp. KBW03 TaxID=2153362 RepID=UPI001E6455D4|nr:hypothetical protein [Chryseobacterium sp. KBW03]
MPEGDNIYKMEIKMHIPQMNIINFLQKKGYEVKGYVLVIEAVETMLLSEPRQEIYTFTATKAGESQSAEKLYLNVFETELNCFLKENI